MPRTKPLIDKNYESPKKETEKRKRTDIPKEFIKKIKNLGMNVEDAELLFKSKIDWCAVYSDNKIYCVEPGCDFVTNIDSVKLTNHMVDVHKYGEYRCNYDHCEYVAASKVKIISCSLNFFEIIYSEKFEFSHVYAHKAIRKEVLVQVFETQLSIVF